MSKEFGLIGWSGDMGLVGVELGFVPRSLTFRSLAASRKLAASWRKKTRLLAGDFRLGSGLTSVVFGDGEGRSAVSGFGSEGRLTGSVLTFVSFDSYGAFG